ncbi:molybdopterin synthase sulfur carrier subunit, partial [Lecanoromycetidae sp. Uapishka_2]
MTSGKPPAGHFRLLYFASASSFTRKSLDDFPAPMPIEELFGLLEKRYPGMTEAILSSSAVTLNLDYIDIERDEESVEPVSGPKTTTINEGDEVAIIPPVSSG